MVRGRSIYKYSQEKNQANCRVLGREISVKEAENRGCAGICNGAGFKEKLNGESYREGLNGCQRKYQP